MFNNIQMLRGFAILMVFLFHSLPHYEAMNGGFYSLKFLMSYGFVGVDIFFVISGFIMMHLSSTERENGAGVFLRKRIVRIYAGYWPCLLIAMIELGVNSPVGFDRISLFNSIFLTSIDMNQLVIPVTWSLTYELYFYVLFAVLIRVFIRHLNIINIIIFSFILLCSFFVPYKEGTLLSFLISPFLLEFFAGCILYRFKEKLSLKKLLLLPYLLMAIICFYLGVTSHATNNFIRIQTFGMFAFFLVLFFASLESNKIYVAGKLENACGAASYYLYLLHLVLISIFYYSGFRGWLMLSSPITREIGFLLFIGACFYIAFALHKYCEIPLNRITRRWIGAEHASLKLRKLA